MTHREGRLELVRAIGAYATSTMAEWALWVATLVFAYQHGGARTVGIASLTLLVPSAAAAVLAAPAADGRRPDIVLLCAHATQALALAGATVTAAVGGPPVLVVSAVAIAIAATALVRPAFAVVIPGVVRTVGQLTTANLFTGYADNAGVLLGPLLAAAAIAAHGPPLALGIAAALTLSSALACVPLVRSHRAVDDEPPPRPRPFAALRAGSRTMTATPGVRGVFAVVLVEYVVIGALDLVYVVFALDSLGLAESSAGFLSAGFGAGCVLGGLFAGRLVGRGRLSRILVIALGGCALALCTAGVLADSLVVAIGLLALAGTGRALADLTARMLLQRAAPTGALAAAFSLVEVLTAAGLALGSGLAQLLIAVSGPRAALIGAAAAVLAAVALATPSLRHADHAASVPVVVIQLLRRIPAFAALQGAAIEGVARAAVEQRVAAGSVVIHQGDVGDRYYAVADGEVEVQMDGRHLRSIRRGDGFGEIALLADVPRIATVTATEATTLYAIDRDPFLVAVTGSDSSHQAAWRWIGRLDTGSALDGRMSAS